MVSSLKEARRIAGALGEPSKMPGMAYGLPARACKVGSKLRKVEGSTCSTCYALKGRYVFDSVLNAEQYRLDSLDHPQWVDAMVLLIGRAPKRRRPYFRWHDAGDLQSIEHLEAIVEVARRLPKVKFWLPTREQGIIRAYVAQFEDFPPNLVVRMSAAMIDGTPPAGFSLTSGVHRESPLGRACPAHLQGNKCGRCRACWDSRVKHVSYPVH